MLLGPLELATLNEWEPSPGSLVSWHPSPAARAKAHEAPVSPVPPSYIQERHLRSFSQQAARGLDHSRLLVASCEVFGRCDIRAMTYVINAHLRRHDTYRSWFEYQDADHIVRHTIADLPITNLSRPRTARRAPRRCGTTFWLHRIHCSGIASASGLFSVQTASPSMRALIISMWTVSSLGWDSWSSRRCTLP